MAKLWRPVQKHADKDIELAIFGMSSHWNSVEMIANPLSSRYMSSSSISVSFTPEHSSAVSLKESMSSCICLLTVSSIMSGHCLLLHNTSLISWSIFAVVASSTWFIWVFDSAWMIQNLFIPCKFTEFTNFSNISGHVYLGYFAIKTFMLLVIFQYIHHSSSRQSSQSCLGALDTNILCTEPFFNSLISLLESFWWGEYGFVCFSWQWASTICRQNVHNICSFDSSIRIVGSTPSCWNIRIWHFELHLWGSDEIDTYTPEVCCEYLYRLIICLQMCVWWYALENTWWFRHL